MKSLFSLSFELKTDNFMFGYKSLGSKWVIAHYYYYYFHLENQIRYQENLLVGNLFENLKQWLTLCQQLKSKKYRQIKNKKKFIIRQNGHQEFIVFFFREKERYEDREKEDTQMIPHHFRFNSFSSYDVISVTFTHFFCFLYLF